MKLYVKVNQIEHGQEIPGKLGRWCKVHQVIHGRFYICEAYPLGIKQEIIKEERNWLYTSANYALVFLFLALLLYLA